MADAVDSTELRRLARARAAHWWVDEDRPLTVVRPIPEALEDENVAHTHDAADAAFIAAANPSTVLALLDDLDALRDEVDRLHAALRDQTCQYVETSDEGTSYCTLAEARGDAVVKLSEAMVAQREPWTTCDPEGNRYRVEVDDIVLDALPQQLGARLVPIDPQETHE